MPNIISRVISLFFFFSLVACYEAKEGCLDIDATNFEFEADDDCCENKSVEDCCCEYPSLKLSIKHQYGDENLSLSRPYTNLADQVFTIKSVEFLISSVEVSDGSRSGVTDRLSLATSSGQQIDIIDDIRLLTTSSFSVDAGSFLEIGIYDTLYCRLGVDPLLLDVAHDAFPASHVLHSTSVLRDSASHELYTGRLVFDSDTSTMELDTLLLPSAYMTNLQIPLIESIEKKAGSDLTVRLGIDYSKWFDEVDFEKDDHQTIRQKILQRISDSITSI